MLKLKQYNNYINQLELLTRFQTDFTYQCGISSGARLSQRNIGNVDEQGEMAVFTGYCNYNNICLIGS